MKIKRIVFIALMLAAAACVLCIPALAADTALTRGGFVTALFAMSPENAAEDHQEAFDDAAPDGELARAIRWASDKGIVNGYGNRRFGPDDPVTREQAATMLYRYAGALGLSTRGDPIFSAGLSDSDRISAYADAAMQWAVMNRIVTGTDNGLEPKGVVTEEQLMSVVGSWNRFLAFGGENKGVCILFTSDVHCGIDQGFGYAGLWRIKDTLEADGYTVLLVDDGDSIQGEVIGTLTKGEAIIKLMNELGYDAASVGNHEFDYGMARFFELAEEAEFPLVSCNFTYLDEPALEAYVIREAAGVKIAFVGVATPESITDSTPVFFQDENGEFVYGFMQDETGEKLYAAVQAAVDSARAEGADLVYVMGHLGMEATASPWTYADVIEHTGGIDVFLDGHSHDTEQVVMKDKDGNTVVRSACGTKLSCVGYSFISSDGKIVDTGIWSWTNKTSAQELPDIQNKASAAVDAAKREIEELTNKVVAESEVELTIYDPVKKDSSGKPVRMVRRAETNLGDFCADVLREETGAEIALISGGGIRNNIRSGDITYGDIISVWPFQNSVCVIKATGQQILDGLEWGARSTPGENGGFFQTSGLCYEIHVNVPNGCIADASGMMTGIEGERRVKNVTVNGEAIDPERIYSVAGVNYTLLQNGDGFTAFDGADVLIEDAGLDNQILIDYITEKLGGVIGAEYADPCGQGRITFTEAR